MPIITPAYPAINSTVNVFRSSLTVIKKEFLRACDVCEKFINNCYEKEQVNQFCDELFEKSDFFFRYRNYLMVTASGPDQETHRKWKGFIESRLRTLARSLECEDISYIHLFPKEFDPNIDTKQQNNQNEENNSANNLEKTKSSENNLSNNDLKEEEKKERLSQIKRTNQSPRVIDLNKKQGEVKVGGFLSNLLSRDDFLK
eukprot:Anaeramoba_ignava/a610565_14.p1 GENE.a610565_14~~a610565_14.p1  ORF type:complete len:201 (-),score=67.83 a610565_14:28-630(-)